MEAFCLSLSLSLSGPFRVILCVCVRVCARLVRQPIDLFLELFVCLGPQAPSQERELRRIQISALATGDSLEAETPIVAYSPSFAFVNRRHHHQQHQHQHENQHQYQEQQQPEAKDEAETRTETRTESRPGSYLGDAGRPVKAEVKLLVKTADVGFEAIEIRSIREFVDVPVDVLSTAGPFSRIFHKTKPPTVPPAACAIGKATIRAVRLELSSAATHARLVCATEQQSRRPRRVYHCQTVRAAKES